MNIKDELQPFQDAIREQAERIRTLEAENAAKAAALQASPCHCRKITDRQCPQCGGVLERVRNTGGYLNDEQFDSVRAGDYYCESCKGAEARTGFKYFWERELKSSTIQCARCAALAPGAGEGLRRDSDIINWLNEQTVDVIYLDDGRIIDVKGLDVRSAVDAARRPDAGEETA